jgi:hypothetical protein
MVEMITVSNPPLEGGSKTASVSAAGFGEGADAGGDPPPEICCSPLASANFDLPSRGRLDGLPGRGMQERI